MKKHLLGIFTLLLTQSCIDAPSNGRNKGPSKNPNRNEQANPSTGEDKKYRSQMFRARGSSQLDLDSIQKAISQGKLPDTYHLAIRPSLDNDSQVIRHNHNLVQCGHLASHETVKQRISHCKSLNPSNYHWSGQVNGISGEGNWQIVTKLDSGSDSTLWLDNTTGLIWSHLLKAQAWDTASGAIKEDDLTYCESLNQETNKQISWRLPNRNEFLQADLNGARFVLPETDNTFWTSSSDSADYKNFAWTINQSTGVLQKVDKNMPHEVRCVGVVIK